MSDPFDQEAERRFVEEVIGGQQEAIVTFEKRIRCIGKILAVLNARRGRPLDEHDLADLAQSTIVIAWRKLPTYRPLAPLEVWLHRLCFYEFANALRRRNRERRNRSGEVDVEDLAVADAANNMNDDIHRAIERLGGLEAEIIRLKHFDGLTFAEIALRAQEPENTVKTRYYRGLRRLEQLLRGTDEDGENES